MIQVGLKKDTFTVCIHALICSKFRGLGETSNSVLSCDGLFPILLTSCAKFCRGMI